MSTEPAVIRADHNAKFYRRFLLMGLGLLAFMVYCLYDGLYAWPLQHERFVAYKELVDDSRGSEWEDLATSKGWPLEPPEKDRTDLDIANQFFMAGGCAIIATFLLLKVFLARGRWMEADGSRITTSWGQTVEYDAVTQINKKKWQNKGIAKIKYQDGNRPRTFVLDDFKFHREPTDEMLLRLEQAAGADKIVGGYPEPLPGEEGTDSDPDPEAGPEVAPE